jgi:pimeloyl-ACP methyl ester carboxylesterase
VEVVRASGHAIAYERVGEGRRVVLVHGAAVDSRMWGPQLAALADEFTVVACNEPAPELFNDAVREFCRAHPPHTA